MLPEPLNGLNENPRIKPQETFAAYLSKNQWLRRFRPCVYLERRRIPGSRPI